MKEDTLSKSGLFFVIYYLSSIHFLANVIVSRFLFFFFFEHSNKSALCVGWGILSWLILLLVGI